MHVEPKIDLDSPVLFALVITMTSFEYHDEPFDQLMDVFTDDILDVNDYTGGDWFALALSASHGGSAVHGVSFAPSCELLAKCDLGFAQKHAVGWLKVSDAPIGAASVTGDPDGVYQANPPFRGIRTTSHIDVIAEDAKWESSNATRAKHAAIVAATAESFGTNRTEAKAFAEACVGGELEDQVLDALILPVSALKRDAASLGKANHSVYGRGTNQSMVTWADSSLKSDALPPTASLDWARMTATARYIAEANMQLDPRFARAASTHGIPYAVIRNSWAHVSSTDYAPREVDWGEIRGLGEGVQHVPTLKGYYAEAREDTYAMLVRALSLCDENQASSVYEALVSALAQVPVRRPDKTIRRQTGTELYADVGSHVVTAQSAAQLTRDSGTSWQALVDSFRVSELNDKTSAVYKASEALVLAARKRDLDSEEVTANQKVVLARVVKQDVWLLASHQLANLLSNATAADKRMRDLYRHFVGSSATWEHPPRLGPRMIYHSKVRTVSLVKSALLGKVPVMPKAPLIGSLRAVTSLSTFNLLLVNARMYLDTAKAAWGGRYQRLANLYGSGSTQDDRRLSVLYGVASKAMATMTPEMLTAADSGFVLASKPQNTYLWLAAKSYARKRAIKWEVKPMVSALSAKEIAEYLDKALNPPIPFVECEGFAREKVTMLAKDILDGVAESVPSDEEPVFTPAPSKPEVDAQAALLAMLEAEMAAFSMPTAILTVTLQAVERSYPETVDIEAYARANGYATFEEAFEALGDKCVYDIENEFTQKAMTHVAPADREVTFKEDEEGAMF